MSSAVQPVRMPRREQEKSPWPHHRLLDFYDPTINGNAKIDGREYTFDEIIKWEPRERTCHKDWIKWFFPLPELREYKVKSSSSLLTVPESSRHVRTGPVLDETVFQAFNLPGKVRDGKSPEEIRLMEKWADKFKDRLHRAAGWLAKHLGYQPMKEPLYQLNQRGGENFYAITGKWYISHHEAHIWITQAIRSLRILGSEAYASALYAAVTDEALRKLHSGQPAPESFQYWKRALTYSEWVRVEKDVDDGQADEGVTWLASYKRPVSKVKQGEPDN
jgi:hypothetical protein